MVRNPHTRLLFLVPLLLALGSAAPADEPPPPVGEVRLALQLLASDPLLLLRLAPDGAAAGAWASQDGEERGDGAFERPAFGGRWCLGAGRLDVRLSRTGSAAGVRSALGPARWLDVQVRREADAAGLLAQHRFDRESWVPSRSVGVATGTLPELPNEGDAAAALTGRQASGAVFAEEPYVYAASGRLRVCLGVTNRGDDVLDRVTIAVRPGAGGAAAVLERSVQLPGTIEPSEYRRFVDLDAGPWPAGKEEGGRRVEASVVVRSARIAPKIERGALRLRGHTQIALLADIEVLFAWPAGEDRYVVLVKNRGAAERTGVGLEVVYRDRKGAVLERLPLPVGRPLAPGEVRILREVAPSPRGAAAQRYFLFALDSVRVETRVAYPSSDKPRFGADAASVYDGIGVARLRLGGTRGEPVFSFELSNAGSRSLERVQLVFAGTDAKQNLVALATAPLPESDDGARALQPDETRPCRVRIRRLYGIPAAVLTWTVVVGDLELGPAKPGPKK